MNLLLNHKKLSELIDFVFVDPILIENIVRSILIGHIVRNIFIYKRIWKIQT